MELELDPCGPPNGNSDVVQATAMQRSTSRRSHSSELQSHISTAKRPSTLQNPSATVTKVLFITEFGAFARRIITTGSENGDQRDICRFPLHRASREGGARSRNGLHRHRSKSITAWSPSCCVPSWKPFKLVPLAEHHSPCIVKSPLPCP